MPALPEQSAPQWRPHGPAPAPRGECPQARAGPVSPGPSHPRELLQGSRAGVREPAGTWLWDVHTGLPGDLMDDSGSSQPPTACWSGPVHPRTRLLPAALGGPSSHTQNRSSGHLGPGCRKERLGLQGKLLLVSVSGPFPTWTQPELGLGTPVPAWPLGCGRPSPRLAR